MKNFPSDFFHFSQKPHRVFQNMEENFNKINLERICKIYSHNNMEDKTKNINLEIICKC